MSPPQSSQYAISLFCQHVISHEQVQNCPHRRRCLTAVRSGYPMAWHNKKYISITKPDMVIFGRGLLLSGLAVVTKGSAFGFLPPRAIHTAIIKWRPKVTCM